MTRVIGGRKDYVAELELQLRALGLPPGEREYRFHPERRWRFDLAWPAPKLALEVDGGTWIAGRHSTGVGSFRDAEKYSEAAILGWRIIRVVPHMIRDGIAAGYVERAFGIVNLVEVKTTVRPPSNRIKCVVPSCMTRILATSADKRCQFHQRGGLSER